jgi:hypothetical protein
LVDFRQTIKAITLRETEESNDAHRCSDGFDAAHGRERPAIGKADH